ncbi:MAG: type I restriction enzyme HsdR N-terminal domain-containing protein [Bacteroidales bacterium]
MTKKRVNKGYITDYISGGSILNTVKELKTTQLLSKLLVEDYHYPKELIRTYPQFKVKGRSEKSHHRCPVDLVIFNNITQNDDSINTIVLCNRRSARKEEDQLKLFLRFSKANFGIYYEKNSFHFICKKHDNGSISFKTISNIPMYGQTAEEVGIIKREQLKPTSNLKTIMECIINYLLHCKTKDLDFSILAEQLMHLIICKLFDERYTHPHDFVSFYAEIAEESTVVKQRITYLFKQVKLNYHDILAPTPKF